MSHAWRRPWRAARDRIVLTALRAAGRRAARPLRGTHRLPGLGGAVRIAFDEHAVPHIEATCESDLVRAQGFVQGLDRPFQMDLLRTALAGRLASWFGDRPTDQGPLAVWGGAHVLSDVDLMFRVLGLETAATASLPMHAPATRALLEAFAEGVNAAWSPGAPRGRSLEHRLLRRRPGRWTAVDSLLVAKGMALGLGFAWRSTPVFAAIAKRLEDAPEHWRQLMPRDPGPDTATLLRALVDLGGALEGFLPGPAAAVGSNAVLVGAARSTSGSPLVGSDPHLELSIPGVWHLASLATPEVGAVGASLVGLPGIVIGRTRHVAWGLTNAMLDDGDLWREQVDTAGERYRLDGAWQPLPSTSLVIERRGVGPRVVRVRRTHRGPLLTDAFPRYAGAPCSLRLVLHEPAAELDAFVGLLHAKTVDDALTAFDGFGSPAQNLVIADTAGDAAYRMVGRVPLRAEGHVPGLPLDGTTRASDWRGFVPRDEVPAARIAPDAVFVTANDPIVGPPYPHHLSHLYEPDHRARRLRERLEPLERVAAEDVAAAQLDVVNRSFLRWRASLLVPHVDEVRRQRPHLAPLVDRLLTWDGREHPAARGAVLAHLLAHHLVRQIFGARLGSELLAGWMSQVNLVDTALHRALEDPHSAWAPPEARAGLLARALDEVDRELHARGWTPDVTWGTWHTLTLVHPLGREAPRSRFFDRGPWPAAGGPFTPCSGQYDQSRPGPQRVGPSYRHVVDLAEPGGRMITMPGQSGHPASAHYDDLVAPWQEGRWLPMRLVAPVRPARRAELTP